MEWMSATEAASRWSVTPQWVTSLCRKGMVKGAQMQAHRWLIPQNAPNPFAISKIEGLTVTSVIEDLRVKPVPVGVSNFKELVSGYDYVDKTLLIRDLLDAKTTVTLFCRPRRFGKTLNLDMLRTFFEINQCKTDGDTSRYFRDTLIWKCGDRYTRHQGSYPVVWLSLKDAKGATWDDCLYMIKACLRTELLRHEDVLNAAISPYEAEQYRHLLSDSAPDIAWSNSLTLLTKLLDDRYGIAPIVLVDEYDTPIQQGHANGYYNQAVAFIRSLLSGAFKDNRHLSFACLTGVLRIAKESIFSGLNNITVRTMLDNQYAEHFGFTHDEIRNLLYRRGKLDCFGEACSWYDGYRFGDVQVFNPWSIVSYISNGFQPAAYWVNTGSNDAIRSLVARADAQTAENLVALIQGQSVFTRIDPATIYPLLDQDPSNLYSLLVMAGYLQAQPAPGFDPWSGYYDLSIPNREVREAYRREVLSYLAHSNRDLGDTALVRALARGDAAALQAELKRFIASSISCHDTAHETFYHGLLLGLTAIMRDAYRLTSNRESGDGRFDIQLAPKDTGRPGILIEVKALRAHLGEEVGPDALEQLAHKALEQIGARSYTTELFEQGISEILTYGVAFHKKTVAVETAMQKARGQLNCTPGSSIT